MRVDGVIALLAGMCCIVPSSRCPGQESLDQAQASVMRQPCATDPVYRQLELLQRDAYLAESNIAFIYLIDQATTRQVLDAVSTKIGDLPPSLMASLSTKSPTEEGQQIIASDAMIVLHPPTCYENPFNYLFLEHASIDMRRVTEGLGYKLPQEMRFGTLPSTDINAHTYIFGDDGQTVVVLNAGLINFVHAIANLCASLDTPEAEAATSRDALASIISEQITVHPELKVRLTEALRDLLNGKPVTGKEEEDTQHLVVAAGFEAGMLRFVVAHELGHIILGHSSPKRLMSVGVSGGIESSVLARSYQQELQADARGIRLTTRFWFTGMGIHPKGYQLAILASVAPIIFFEAEDILDSARQTVEGENGSAAITPKQQKLYRDCARKQSVAAQCKELPHQDHPPAWLRGELAESEMRAELGPLVYQAEVKAAFHTDDVMAVGLRMLWESSRGSFGQRPQP